MIDALTQTISEQLKAIWLTQGRYTVSLQIETNNKSAYLAIEDSETDSVGHELAIGLRDGVPFLQVSHGEVFESIDLIDFIRGIKKSG